MLPFYHGCFYGAEAVTRTLPILTVQCFTDAADISFIGIITDLLSNIDNCCNKT
jgi:hypothetical protein